MSPGGASLSPGGDRGGKQGTHHGAIRLAIRLAVGAAVRLDVRIATRQLLGRRRGLELLRVLFDRRGGASEGGAFKILTPFFSNWLNLFSILLMGLA